MAVWSWMPVAGPCLGVFLFPEAVSVSRRSRGDCTVTLDALRSCASSRPDGSDGKCISQRSGGTHSLIIALCFTYHIFSPFRVLELLFHLLLFPLFPHLLSESLFSLFLISLTPYKNCFHSLPSALYLNDGDQLFCWLLYASPVLFLTTRASGCHWLENCISFWGLIAVKIRKQREVPTLLC